jgi:hypothetical protein
MEKNSKRETGLKESQIDRFKEAARQLEVDESEAVFDEKLKALTGKRQVEPKKD